MSKEYFQINAFNRRFSIKKSNKNMRLSYEYYTKISTKNKALKSSLDQIDKLEKQDLGEKEATQAIMDGFSSVSQSSMDFQNVPYNFIKEILKLNPKQVSMLDDMTGDATAVLAGRLAHGVTSDEEDIDPKKPRKRSK
ncbi:hypothetical protein [Companilactobacillus nodensis]|uniref:Uncharacterized protein n=1 Tax=Companilactobacillus nodensis DSM 19682 = JCM 14932 = NBRC 107160 TaxID=1423775 RepID=A0A0R1KDF3_9LACO|nr:hypothetical protein [Companilactobacillus nodensis]KRK78756.1 hypothetical protein FD03_GL002534 [Companilactobacillus nodensis DSM 19682 = JCM 14932 = NBRC 107160]